MHKVTTKDIGLIKKVGISLVISLICYLTVSLGCCIALFFSKNPTSGIKIISLLSFLLSGAASGFISAKIIKSQSLLASVFGSTAFSCALFVLSLFSGGNALNMIMNVVCYILISAFFTYLGGIKKRKTRRIRR